jgi:hypothetical protein
MYSMAPMSEGSRWINGRDEAALAGRWWRNPAPTSAISLNATRKGRPKAARRHANHCWWWKRPWVARNK